MGILVIGLFVISFTFFLNTLAEEKRDYSEDPEATFKQKYEKEISLVCLALAMSIISADALIQNSSKGLLLSKISESTRGHHTLSLTIILLIGGVSIKNYWRWKFAYAGAAFLVLVGIFLLQNKLINNDALALEKQGWHDTYKCRQSLKNWEFSDNGTLPIVSSGLGGSRQTVHLISPFTPENSEISDWQFCLFEQEDNYNKLRHERDAEGYELLVSKPSLDGSGNTRFYAIWIKGPTFEAKAEDTSS